MSVLTGADTRCLVASPLNRLRDFDDLEDESLVKFEPAALNQQALKVLKSLIFLSHCLSVEDRWQELSGNLTKRGAGTHVVACASWF
jgi:hypothetical protein